MKRHILTTTARLSATALSMPMCASAQTETAHGGASENGCTGIEDNVVTALRREECSHRAAVAMSVIGGSTILSDPTIGFNYGGVTLNRMYSTPGAMGASSASNYLI